MKRSRRALLLLLLATAVVTAVMATPIAQHLAELTAWTQAHPHTARLAFVASYIAASVLAVPASLLTVAAGLFFGLPLGFLLVFVGSVTGATAAFLTGRFVARDWVAHRIAQSPRYQALDAATRREGFLIVLLARMSPLIPFNVLNYGLSVTAVHFRHYVLGTMLGMPPVILIYVYLGTLARNFTELPSAGAGNLGAERALLAIALLATAGLTILIARVTTRAFNAHLALASAATADTSAAALQSDTGAPDARLPAERADIAIVIPVHEDLDVLEQLLRQLAELARLPREVVIVSAGANDAVHALCRQHGCRYLETSANRGAQLDFGARAASAGTLWFLHADAKPESSALAAIETALAGGADSGCFQFRFEGPRTWYKNWLATLTNLRVRLGGTPYGDQGLFVRRALYLECGGYAHEPLFEEVELIKKLRARGTFRRLAQPLGVSPRRWERGGWWRRSLHNRWLALCYTCGVSAQRLAAKYRSRRQETRPP